MAGWKHFRRQAGSDGSVAIEYAIIIPVLLLLLLGIMDVSRLLWTYTTLHRGVEAAARCASINVIKCGTTGAIQTYAAGEVWGLTVAPSAFTVSYPACGVQVKTIYNFRFVIPWYYVASPFGAQNSISIEATACYVK